MKDNTSQTTVGQSLDINIDYRRKSTPLSIAPFSINQLQEFINTAKENGATHIKIFGAEEDGCVYFVEIQPYRITDKTINQTNEAQLYKALKGVLDYPIEDLEEWAKSGNTMIMLPHTVISEAVESIKKYEKTLGDVQQNHKR